MNSYVINVIVKIRFLKIFVRTERRRCSSLGICKKEAVNNLINYLKRVTYQFRTIKSIEIVDVYKVR